MSDNFSKYKPDDILVVFGLEEGLCSDKCNVLPPCMSDKAHMHAELSTLIRDFPGMVIVIRSLMDRNNVIFQKTAYTRHYNSDFNSNLKHANILNAGSVKRQFETIDKLEQYTNPVARKNPPDKYNKQTYKAHEEQRDMKYFGFIDHSAKMTYDQLMRIQEAQLRNIHIPRIKPYKDVLERLTCTMAYLMLRSLTKDQTEHDVMKRIAAPLYFMEESSMKDFMNKNCYNYELMIESFTNGLTKDEVKHELYEEGNKLFDTKITSKVREEYRDLITKELEKIRIEDDTDFSQFTKCKINHDKISADLEVPKYCLYKSKGSIVCDTFQTALLNRKHPTMIAYRDNMHSYGCGENCHIRGHNLLNSLIDLENMLILPHNKKRTPQEEEDIKKKLETSNVGAYSDESTKRREKMTTVMEYLMSRFSCNSQTNYCTNTNGQWNKGNKCMNLASCHNSEIEIISSQTKIKSCYLHYSQIFSQNVYFAGFAPSKYSLEITLNSLMPFIVEEKSQSHIYRCQVDIDAILLTDYTALPIPKYPGFKTKSKEEKYELALSQNKAPLFRRILWSDDGRNDGNDDSLITGQHQHEQRLQRGFGPGPYLFGNVGYESLDDESKHITDLLCKNTLNNAKPIDLGCNITVDDEMQRHWSWRGTPTYMMCPELGGLFQTKQYGIYYQSARKLFWSTYLPIATDLRTLDTYRNICPEREDFAHVRNARSILRTTWDFKTPQDLLFKPRVITEGGMLREGCMKLMSHHLDKQLLKNVQEYVYIDLTDTCEERKKKLLIRDLVRNGFKKEVVSMEDGKISIAPCSDLNLTDSSVYNIESIHDEDDDSVEYAPEYQNLVRIEPLFKPLHTVPNILVLLVDIPDSWRFTRCFDSSCLHGVYTLIVAFGDLDPSKAPSTEELFAMYPFANHICNVTNKVDTLEDDEDEELIKIVDKQWERERKGFKTYLQGVLKIFNKRRL